MKRYLLLVVLAAASVPAAAQGFNYNFVEATYGQLDFDDLNVDGDFFGVGGSLAINENFHGIAAYESADLDFGVDATSWNIGVGFNTPISPVIDVVAQLTYESVEVSLGSAEADDDGLGLAVGLRANVSEAVELNFGVKYVDLDDSGDDTALGAAFLMDLTDNFAIGLNGSWGDDASAYGIFGRFYFDR
ncbi:MAG: outer membrane beta-barrel protein [Gammaproteobacteria bacterium]|nr:outer membrane beta-barrel protein [Gammaproteobacteria bacterium]MDH4254684.1 outer membrane beta-barrel protein [Gammaproteobacteria bacterium]MDH5310018.1 outer membrane beta-barrel protein [Gammaproteobacteria bacterium]